MDIRQSWQVSSMNNIHNKSDVVEKQYLIKMSNYVY